MREHRLGLSGDVDVTPGRRVRSERSFSFCSASARFLIRPRLLRQSSATTARSGPRATLSARVVTEHEPDQPVGLAVVRPFPMLVRYELDGAPDGRLVAIHATGTPGGFFRWATPMMKHQVNKSIAGDLYRVRTCLET